MPRFFFDVEDGRASYDNEGTVFQTVEEARWQGIVAASEMLREDSGDLMNGSIWTMSIFDDDRTLVCTLRFTADYTTGREPH